MTYFCACGVIAVDVTPLCLYAGILLWTIRRLSTSIGYKLLGHPRSRQRLSLMTHSAFSRSDLTAAMCSGTGIKTVVEYESSVRVYHYSPLPPGCSVLQLACSSTSGAFPAHLSFQP